MNRLLQVTALAIVFVPWAAVPAPADRGGDHPPYIGTLGKVDLDKGTVPVVCSDDTWIGYTGEKTKSITLDGKPCSLKELVGKEGYSTTADGPKRRSKDFDAITIAVTSPKE
jgi:hypothetical protein